MWEKRQTLSRSRARAGPGGGGEATFILLLLSSFFCDVMWPRIARLLTEGGWDGAVTVVTRG